MFSVAIYSENFKELERIKNRLKNIVANSDFLAKISFFSNKEELLVTPNRYDVYIFDMENNEEVLNLGKEMELIDKGSALVYLGTEAQSAKAAKALVEYYLIKPAEKHEITHIIQQIKKKHQEDNVLLKLSNGVEKKIRSNLLNYINIEGRSLCYHLTDGTIFDGSALRNSFLKSIVPLNTHPSFYLVGTSLLINLSNVDAMNDTKVIFEDGSYVFIPKVHKETFHDVWLNFNRLIEFK